MSTEAHTASGSNAGEDGGGFIHHPVLFYDARCGVCRRFIRMAVRADRKGLLRIAPLQGPRGDALREAYPEFRGRESAVLVTPSEPPRAFSDAILGTMDYLGGRYRVLARLGRLVPRVARDWGYRTFARNRPHMGWLDLPDLDDASKSRLLPDEGPTDEMSMVLDQAAFCAYLNDHLAASVAALRLIDRIRETHSGTPLGTRMDTWAAEVGDEQQRLRSLVTAAGGTVSPVAQAVGWLGEQLSRVKVGAGAHDASGLELFEALEALSVGFHGRLGLWRSLAVLDTLVPGGSSSEFTALADRAVSHLGDLESFRLEASWSALTRPDLLDSHDVAQPEGQVRTVRLDRDRDAGLRVNGP